jgi:hypothetical protein
MEWSPPHVPRRVRQACILLNVCWMAILGAFATYSEYQFLFLPRIMGESWSYASNGVGADPELLRTSRLLEATLGDQIRKHGLQRDMALLALPLPLLWFGFLWLVAGFCFRR